MSVAFNIPQTTVITMAKNPQQPVSELTPSAPPAHVRALPDYTPPTAASRPAPPPDNRPVAERINLPDADVAAAIANATGLEPVTHAPTAATHHCGHCGRIHVIGSCPRDTDESAGFKRFAQCGNCGRLHWSDEACPV